jgi:hypothetical protein
MGHLYPQSSHKHILFYIDTLSYKFILQENIVTWNYQKLTEDVSFEWWWGYHISDIHSKNKRIPKLYIYFVK